jgi:hypothetical protein
VVEVELRDLIVLNIYYPIFICLLKDAIPTAEIDREPVLVELIDEIVIGL